MTRMVLTLMFAVAVCVFPASALLADVLLIEEVRQAENMDLPANGMSSSDVVARFGEPAEKYAPVGDPPITRWDYPRWSVYFEYDLVLFTVLEKGQVVDKNKD